MTDYGEKESKPGISEGTVLDKMKLEKALKFEGSSKQSIFKRLSKAEFEKTYTPETDFEETGHYKLPLSDPKAVKYFGDFDEDWNFAKKRAPGRWLGPGKLQIMSAHSFEEGKQEIKRGRELNLLKGNGIDTVLVIQGSNEDEFVKAKNVAVDYITTVKKMNRLYEVQENVALVAYNRFGAKVVHHLTCQYDDVLSSLEKLTFKGIYEPEEIWITAYSATVARGKPTFKGIYEPEEIWMAYSAIVARDHPNLAQ